MHIKELRIAGFKSFVDPEAIPIERGLTGIVGPNGCGKSNLLEALRWAMGATSARAMRGGEMDDLIFNGAAGRPARELAEVTLVLDNQARTAPAEFNSSDTLEVMRRLKRGAGSTYKLNGRTVRGKDVKLIFADASTGANSPSLVRQGQISELIASKPQNRRRILEEAAGISGLNARRHEAELKLNAAETNLDRLSEVSAEVERQLDSLRRQARKARKYKEFSQKIRALEAYCAHLRWCQAVEDRDQAATALTEARDALERLTRDAAVKETARLEASEKLPPLRQAEAEISGRLGQAKIDLARVETEHSAAAAQLSSLKRDQARILEDLERETSQLDEARSHLDDAQNRLAALPKPEETRNQDQEAAAEAALLKAQEQLRLAEAAADLAASELAERRAEKQALEASLSAHHQRRDRLEADIQDLTEKLASLAQSKHREDAHAAAIEAEAAAAAAKLSTEARLEETERAVALCSTAEAETLQPLQSAEDQLRSLETEITGLQRLLREADTYGEPVLKQIKTQDGFEKAVAAALGDDLHAPTTRQSSIYWAGASLPTSAPLPPGVQPLSEFVDAPDALAARLSQCGLVSAEAGPDLAASLRPGQRLVSAEGHLWRWDGFTRTPDAPVSAAERLAQRARLDAAQRALGPSRQTLAAARLAHDTAQGQTRAAESDQAEARNRLKTAVQAFDAAREALADLARQRDHEAIRIETLTTQLDRSKAELAETIASLDAVDTGVDAQTLEQLGATVEARREDLIRARETETEARGRLNDLTRNRQQALARRQAVEEDITRWGQRIEAGRARIDRLTHRRSETETEIATAAERPALLEARRQALSGAVQDIEADRQAAADGLAVQETDAREKEQAARSATNLAMTARETLAVANARAEASRTKLSELLEATEQFQCTAEGLLPLARDGLSTEEIDALCLTDAEKLSDRLRIEREQLGGINMEAEAEAAQLAERLGMQTEEKNDLIAAISKLKEGVTALNEEGRTRLMQAFDQVNAHFKALFTTLFRGGEAELRLVDAEDPLNAGLEIMAQPPGKRLGTLSLMSGGEQALTATALIFAVFLSRPSPICVLDEVDAPLDDANVDRFCRMLDEMRQRTDTRFIVITHNPVTMSRMDRLFGVTMRERGVSKLVSVDLNAAEQLVAAE